MNAIQNSNIGPENNIKSPEIKEKEPSFSKKRTDIALDIIQNPNTLWEWVNEKKKEGKEALEKEAGAIQWVPTLIKGGLLILGAVEGYRLYNWAFRSDEKEKGEGKEGDGKNSTLTHLGLGSLLGLAAVALYIKKNFGFEPLKEQIVEAAKEIKNGSIQKGMELLRIHPENEEWTNLARELGVRSGQLSQLKDVPWKNFSEHWEGKKTEKSYFRMALEKVGLASSTELSNEEAKSELETKSEEERLWSYISNFKDDIKIEEEDSIEDVLSKIKRARETIKEGGPEPRILESMTEIKAEFSNTADALGTIENAKDTAEYAANIIVGATQDGAGIVVNNIGTFVVKYGVMAPITNLKILGETIVDVAQMGLGYETPQGVVANYLRNTGYYIGIGALSGAAMASFTGKSKIWGAGKGAVWGLTLPVKFYDLTVKELRGMGVASERIESWARNLEMWQGRFSKDPETLARATRAKALFHAARIKKMLNQEQFFHRISGGSILEEISPLPKPTQERILYHLSSFINAQESYLKQIGEVVPHSIHISDIEKGRVPHRDIEAAIDEFTEHHSGLDVGTYKFNSKLNPSQVASNIEMAVNESDRIKKIEGLSQSVDDMEGHFKTHFEEIDHLRHQGVAEDQIKPRIEETQKLGAEGRVKMERAIKELTADVPNMNEAEKTAFANLIHKMNKGRVIKSFIKENLKARGKFGGAIALTIGSARMAWGVYEMSQEDAETQNLQELYDLGKEVGFDTLEMALNILCPFGLLDFYSIYNGTDLQGRELGIWQKVLYGITGTYSAITDIGAAAAALATAEFAGTGGAAVYGAANALETGLRAGGKAPEIIAAVQKLMPKLQQLAQNSGGYKKLIEMLTGPKMQSLMKQSGRLATASQVGALSYAGLQIAYDMSTSETLEIPDEIADKVAEMEKGEELLQAA